jgi:putative Holliday junction resolvase
VRPGVRLGVDVGTVRIGIARSDAGGLLASPADTVRRGPGDLAAIAELASASEAMEVVVGLAVGLGGHEGKAAAAGRAFAEELARKIAPVPVRLVDERFTTPAPAARAWTRPPRHYCCRARSTASGPREAHLVSW